MPTISQFYGVLIRMYFADHAPPHFHAIYGEAEALVEAADAGVFATLREPETFKAVGIAHGAVSWPNQIELAPDALHAAIRADGRCVLR